MNLRRPRALRPGDRVAVVAPASPFPRETFETGLDELRRLGFEPVFDQRVFEVDLYEAGSADTRASAMRDALEDPSIGGVIAVRGGYGSVKLLPLVPASLIHEAAKPIIGYSDLTTLHTYCTCHCGLVAFQGPMLDSRFSRGEAAYDRDTFLRAIGDAAPLGELRADGLETLRPGEASGPLLGGTLTQLTASLGTPYAFDPPAGHVLWIEDVGERPYKLDRMLTQLRQAGILARASALVFGDMCDCDEPSGTTTAREAIARLVDGFPGPAIYGFPSGHTPRPFVTLPLGVRARVVATGAPALVIEEAAVEA